jgi:hypothetical protein
MADRHPLVSTHGADVFAGKHRSDDSTHLEQFSPNIFTLSRLPLPCRLTGIFLAIVDNIQDKT